MKMRNVLVSLAAMAFAGAATADELYFSDFESDDGGWEASADWDPVGDWEWGAYDFNQYTGSYNPPPAAFSGDNVWATVLHGDYTNADGNNWLTQNFDTSGFVNVEFEWANWAEVFFEFDTAELYVNGSLVYERDTSNPPTDWEIETVSLPDDMADVEVQFQLFATTVVERSGWYIDDVRITADPDVPCLMLDVANLVGGERATFTVSTGTPGERAVTVYGLRRGETIVNGLGGYCATFGIDGVSQNRVLGGINQTFDGNGEIQFEVPIPSGASGRTVFFQSAERNTCPDECQSEVIEEVVG